MTTKELHEFTNERFAELRLALVSPDVGHIYELLRSWPAGDNKRIARHYVSEYFPLFDTFEACMRYCGWEMKRTSPEEILGMTFPIFIRNGTHFFSNLHVFADGVVDCWGGLDLAFFREKLENGWVSMQPPIGADISFHSLGYGKVEEAQWFFSNEALWDAAQRCIDKLNPERKGLIDLEGSTVEVRDGVRYSKLPLFSPQSYRVEGEEVIPGTRLDVISVEDIGYCHRHWFVFADGKTRLGTDAPLRSMKDMEALFERGDVVMALPDGEWLIIPGLGRVKIADASWYIDAKERLTEAYDEIDILNGQDGAIRSTIDAFRRYEDDPTDTNREVLRRCYESVPEHNRMYCGDMDSKDWPIRHVLYGSEDLDFEDDEDELEEEDT